MDIRRPIQGKERGKKPSAVRTGAKDKTDTNRREREQEVEL